MWAISWLKTLANSDSVFEARNNPEWTPITPPSIAKAFIDESFTIKNSIFFAGSVLAFMSLLPNKSR